MGEVCKCCGQKMPETPAPVAKIRDVLHAIERGLVGGFGLDHRNGNVGFVEQSVVSTQNRALITVRFIAPHRHAAYAQRVFAINLVMNVPARMRNGGADELFADIYFGELFLIQKEFSLASRRE